MASTTTTPHTAYTEAWLTGPSSTPFYTRTYSPPEGTSHRVTLVLLHGFIEHVGRYDHVFSRFAKQGIAVFCFDERGFGRTAVEGKMRPGGEKSAYGKTSVAEQMQDTEWALKHAKDNLGGNSVPLFVWGHSMGGAIALTFASGSAPDLRAGAPAPGSVSLLSGVIASSPLVQVTHKQPRILRMILSGLGSVGPNAPVPAEVKGDALCHDPEVAKAYLSDPLVKQWGTARGVRDMLNLGDALNSATNVEWPSNLSLLQLHGTDDQITSYKASKAFFDKVQSENKSFIPFEGGYHELQNEPEMKDKFVKDIIAFIHKYSESVAATVPTVLVPVGAEATAGEEAADEPLSGSPPAKL